MNSHGQAQKKSGVCAPDLSRTFPIVCANDSTPSGKAALIEYPAFGKVLYLNVPFSEKDIAKARGARWNPQNRHWYVWPSADLSQFDKWLPPSYAARQILERAKKHLLEQIK